MNLSLSIHEAAETEINEAADFYDLRNPGLGGVFINSTHTARGGIPEPWGGDVNPTPVLKHPSAFLPVAMSLSALATVMSFLALHGPAPQVDEGAAAHIWQLLMACQVPIVVFFAFKWVPRSPRQVLPILALQVGAALAAMAPVFLLHW